MLKPRSTPLANVEKTNTGWRLQIPAGEAGKYRLAQLDDYGALARGNFPVNPPASLSLACRVSSTNIPGTWGFGFWNDPFTVSLGLQGSGQRLPMLPNCCWFFNASPENHLSFHNQFHGSGFLAQVFQSPRIPSMLLLPGLLGLPLLAIKPLSRWLRSITGSIITEDSRLLEVDTTQWHAYSLSWEADTVTFSVDNSVVFQSQLRPIGPLGLVIWIDNQYAAWTASGIVRYSTLQQTAPQWMEIENLEIKSAIRSSEK